VSAGAEWKSLWKNHLNFVLIADVSIAVIVGEKNNPMPKSQVAKNLVRTYIPTAVDGQNLVRFDPQDPHAVTPTHWHLMQAPM
jgi:hypothetical protein